MADSKKRKLVTFPGLAARDFQHPDDITATEALRSVPGLDTVVSKVMEEAPLPAIVAVSDAINEPRYPSLKGIMGAKKKPQDVLSLSELGVDADQAGEAGSCTTVLALGDPPARADARKIEGDGNAAQAIVDFLADKRLV